MISVSVQRPLPIPPPAASPPLRRSVVPLVLAVCSLTVPSSASAGCDPDQSQTATGPWIAIVGSGPGGTYDAGQTFEAGATGTLESVHLYGGVSNASPGEGPLVVELRTATDGLPDAGPPLMVHVIPFSELPPVFFPAVFVIDVATYRVPIQAGTDYAIVLRVDSGAVDWFLRGGDPYPNGAKVQRSAPEGAWETDPLRDAYFSTHVCRTGTASGVGGETTSWGRAKGAYR